MNRKEKGKREKEGEDCEGIKGGPRAEGKPGAPRPVNPGLIKDKSLKKHALTRLR